MTVLTWRPLSTWPGAQRSDSQRRFGQFKVDLGAILGTGEGGLRYELDRLGVDVAVVEVDCPPSGFTRSGEPRVEMVRSPGVVLSFTHPERGPIRIGADLYFDYRDNLRGLGLSLEALRAVNRHGIAGHGEQYTGFARLGAGNDKPQGMTVEQAAIALVPEGWNPEQLIRDKDLAKIAAERARNSSHPDRGGSKDRFQQVEEARRVLFTHHKLTV
jgi:hypothetical protein